LPRLAPAGGRFDSGRFSLRHPLNSLRPVLLRGDMDQTALDLPAAPKTLAKPREGLLARQSALYIRIVLLAAFASYA